MGQCKGKCVILQDCVKQWGGDVKHGRNGNRLEARKCGVVESGVDAVRASARIQGVEADNEEHGRG